MGFHSSLCDRKIGLRRPDIVFIDKKERANVIIGDDRVKDNELEKLEKYQPLGKLKNA